MLFFIALIITSLTCGACTTWHLSHRHSIALAVAAGAAVIIALPILLLITLVAAPPLGYAVTFLAALATVRAYNDGRMVSASTWAVIAVTATTCANWGRG
ncbi:hypothetical protein [Streptomyces sp. NPDC001091]